MGPVRIRHCPHQFVAPMPVILWIELSGKPKWGLCEYVIVHTIWGGSPVILWISLGGKPKWLPLKSGYHDVMRTSPIALIDDHELRAKFAFLTKLDDFLVSSQSSISNGSTGENCVTKFSRKVGTKNPSKLLRCIGVSVKVLQKIGHRLKPCHTASFLLEKN